MLLDLAQFQNVQQNAQMAVTGNHLFGNLNTGAKSQTQFLDTPDGQFSRVKNTNNHGAMMIQGNHQYQNYVNNGQTTVMPRKFSPPRRLEELDEEEELEDLAQFNNVQQNALMDITGTHMIKNLNTGAKSTTNFHDHKDGQFTTVGNTNNLGKMNISGNHKYNQFVNSGAVKVMPRTFPEPKRLEDLQEEEVELEDLASFNNYMNNKGGMTSIQGTHQFKNMTNAKGAKVIVLDHKTGQFSTFGNTNNMGQMQVSGNHQFDNTQNSGQFVVQPRQFDAKGRPIKLMDLAQFNNFVNKAGGNVQITGTHAFKNFSNEKKGNVILNDHKDGQFATIGNMNNAGNLSLSGKHKLDNTINTGNIAVIPRKFKDKKKLMDLAAFNQFANQDGGMLQAQGNHQIKNLSNAKKAIIIFKDDPMGRALTVQNTNNLGKFNIAGNHNFNNFNNGGQVAVTPRTFDAKGRPIKALLI